MQGFKVSRPYGWRYFADLKDAKAFAERIHTRTGHIVEIREAWLTRCEKPLSA